MAGAPLISDSISVQYTVGFILINYRHQVPSADEFLRLARYLGGNLSDMRKSMPGFMTADVVLQCETGAI